MGRREARHHAEPACQPLSEAARDRERGPLLTIGVRQLVAAQRRHVEPDVPEQVVPALGVEVEQRHGRDGADELVSLCLQRRGQLGRHALDRRRVLEREVPLLELGVEIPEPAADPAVESLDARWVHESLRGGVG